MVGRSSIANGLMRWGTFASMIVIGWLDFFLFIQVSLFLLIFFLQASRRYAPRVAMSLETRHRVDAQYIGKQLTQGGSIARVHASAK